MTRFNFAFLLFSLFALFGQAQYFTVNDGSWNSPSTWDSGNVPVANTMGTAYDSIVINHHVTLENGNLAFPAFVNYLMRIDAAGSLTIDARDTLATGQGLLTIPTCICVGELHVTPNTDFFTRAGNTTSYV